MAINDWKNFLMPYEQAVDELKVKLRSIRKEYRRKKFLWKRKIICKCSG